MTTINIVDYGCAKHDYRLQGRITTGEQGTLALVRCPYCDSEEINRLEHDVYEARQCAQAVRSHTDLGQAWIFPWEKPE